MPFATGEDGVSLWYRTYGQGADPILLIAGQALSHQSWDGVVGRFAERQMVTVFDHRGVGRSDDTLPFEWSTRDFARDALMLLDHLGIDRTHVYGFSMGGRIAQWLAADAPDRIRSLTLGATTVGDIGGVKRSAAATQALVSGSESRLRELFFSPDWIAEHSHIADSVLPCALSGQALKAHFRASVLHDARTALKMIKAPTLVMHGAEDVLCPPENASILADGIPDASLHLVEGARHGYYLEFPDTSEVVLDWMAEAGLH